MSAIQEYLCVIQSEYTVFVYAGEISYGDNMKEGDAESLGFYP
jgi:hypothetical protein